MILQHCPKTYKGKPHGCGYGPIHPTKAFLDLGGTCPGCKKPFRPYRKPRPGPTTPTGTVCQARSVRGETYCPNKPTAGEYCRQHEHLHYERG